MSNVLAMLARRVARLDAQPYHRGAGLLDDLEHFVSTMGRITSTGHESDLRGLPRALAADADVAASGSRLLARIEDVVPDIVDGPVRLDAQYWLSWGTTYQYRTRRPILDRTHFVDALESPEIEPSSKPFDVGLFTSTGVHAARASASVAGGAYGMWHVYLGHYQRGTRLGGPPGDYDPPWQVWTVEPEPDVVVREVASAAQWVDFVLAHPRRHGGALYPDWKAAAAHCDAVHVTLRAIAATQGLYFATDQGLVTPTFWDVESTFWLRWRFRSVRLVETLMVPAES